MRTFNLDLSPRDENAYILKSDFILQNQEAFGREEGIL